MGTDAGGDGHATRHEDVPGRPVVTGIDGSASALRAAHLAAEEARRRGAPLHLVCALPRPYTDLVTAAGPDVRARGESATEAALRTLADTLGPIAGREPVTWAIVRGDPVHVLRDASGDASLLVLGSRGAGGLAGLLLGSTANGLVVDAACPVIVLPDESTAVVSARRSVVVGVEGHRPEDPVLAFAFDAATTHGTDLVAVHTWQDSALGPDVASISPLVDWAAVAADEQRVLTEALAGWRAERPDVEVREVVLRERAARGLIATAVTAELLVVGHRRRRRLAALRSTTHGVLHRAACPVAVVPFDDGRER